MGITWTEQTSGTSAPNLNDVSFATDGLQGSQSATAARSYGPPQTAADRAIAHSHANGNCDTDGFDHAEPDSKSDSSRTAASDTRASPDTLSSVAASRTVILAREGISAPARC